jgi:hypothetical protein
MSVSESRTVESVLESLKGRWVTIYSEIGGEASPETAFKETVMEYSDSTFKIHKAGIVAYEGTFSVNLRSTPFGIVLMYSKSINPAFLGGPRAGIIQIGDNTKKTNFSPIGFPAPPDFNTVLNSNTVLSIYRREGFVARTPIESFRSSNFGCEPW